MALTAIEFSDDSCVLVRVTARGTSIEVTGVDILDPSEFPGADAFVEALRRARRAGRFPRRARVVLWGLPDGASVDDPDVRPRLEPLIDAGFRVERAVTPCNALAVLARIRVPRPESATIWLGVNSGAVAVVASRPGEQIYTRAFAWNSSVGAIGSQARLLQRYSLVSYLAPEARQAIAAVREAGAHVDAIVICGALPDLRSLTMPLIEELDVEVETLDSLSGLIVKGPLRETLLELAPAVRIACAGALARPSRPRDAMRAPPHRDWMRIAALFALLVFVASAALLAARWFRAPERPVASNDSVSSAERPSASSPPASTPPVVPAPPAPAAQAPTSGRGQPTPASHPPPTVQSRESASSGRRETPATAPPSESRPRAPLYRTPRRTDTSRSGRLSDPLPHVTTILVAPDRRLAMVDGRIVGVGDRVGQRTVAAIEPRVVVFQEPSGVQIRVGLGGRLVPDDRDS